jgi:penicillin-binding protein 1C
MLNILRERQMRRLYRQSISRVGKIKLISFLITTVFIGVVFCGLLATALFAWYAKDLPKPGKLTERVVKQSTKIFDRNGELLYDIYGDQNRTYVSLSEIPKTLRDATIAIEDKDFYKHQGYDPKGYLRAIRQIVFYHNISGGSTLTQQLIKNVLLSSERTIPRKIKEFILAVQVEKNYTKDQILELYLNEAPYGGTAWGVEAASEMYFGKKVSQLTPGEATLLAGLPQKPSTYSPFGAKPELAYWRQGEVIRRMTEDGYITSTQADQIRHEKITLAPQGGSLKAPHFTLYVKQLLVDQYGDKAVEQGGLRVTTTLDLKLQEEVQKIVSEEVGKAKNMKVGNGAAVVLDPQTGEILAMVGSKDYFAKDYDGNVNVTLSLRQPGSALKPFTYTAAFKKGYTSASLLFDAETHFPGGVDRADYIPKNYDGKFRGPTQVRYGLGNSINLTAVKMTGLVGVKNMLAVAYDAGLSTLAPTDENLKRFGLSITLGGGEVKLLELTSGYGVFATGGIRHDLMAIRKVTDAKNKILFNYNTDNGKRVISNDITYLISNILSDNEARQPVFGPKSWLLVSGKTVAVKTGTTDDKRDNWTIGYTPSVVVGVWVGNNDNSPMDPRLASGTTGAAPIWNRIISFSLQNKKDEQWSRPSSIIEMDVDTLTGGQPIPGQTTRKELFIRGTEPNGISPIYKKIKVSRTNGKIANSVEIAAGDFEEKTFLVFSENDPISTDGRNRWQEGIDSWIAVNYKDDPRYHPPSETSDEKREKMVIRFKAPNDQTEVADHDVLVKADVVSLHEITKLEVSVDHVVRKTVSNASFEEKLNMDTGVHKIKVRAYDSAGNSEEKEIQIGVGVPWNYLPSPTPALTITPYPTPTLTPSPSP